jgi:hypothetical protein
VHETIKSAAWYTWCVQIAKNNCQRNPLVRFLCARSKKSPNLNFQLTRTNLILITWVGVQQKQIDFTCTTARKEQRQLFSLPLDTASIFLARIHSDGSGQQ